MFQNNSNLFIQAPIFTLRNKFWCIDLEDYADLFENPKVRVSVGITVDAPVTALSNKTNDIQCFKDI